MARQLTERAGNPANEIRTQYQDLMSVEDLDVLKSRAIAAVQAGGISAKNAAKFRRAVAESNTLDRLRFYLTNFILAADGLAVG